MELMTPAIAEQLFQNAMHAQETGESADEVVVKYFDPCGAATWYVTDGTPLNAAGEPIDDPDAADDWHLFGFATLGDARCAEYGYTLLSQLKEIERPAGLGIERDLHFGQHSVKECAERIKEENPHRPQL